MSSLHRTNAGKPNNFYSAVKVISLRTIQMMIFQTISNRTKYAICNSIFNQSSLQNDAIHLSKSKNPQNTQIRPEKHTGYVLQCPHSECLLHHCDPLQRAVIPFSAVGGSVACRQTVTTAQTAQIISLKLGLTIFCIICTDTSGQWSSLIFK